jgi:hypothetical protein
LYWLPVERRDSIPAPNLGFDGLTEELEGVQASLEKTEDSNGRLRTKPAVSSPDRERLLEQMKEKAEELDQ